MLPASCGLVGATFVVCLGSAVVPVVNAEIYLLGVSAAVPPALLPAVVLAATLGQMAGKSALYFAGNGFVLLPERWRRLPPGLQERLASSRTGTGVVLISAVTGVPPFYAVTVLAGLLRWSFPRFLAAGTCGRALRFAAVVAVPQYLGSILP